MAITVGIPRGVAVEALLSGQILRPGVQGPYDEKVSLGVGLAPIGTDLRSAQISD